MSEEEHAWTHALELKRKYLVQALAKGDSETADRISEAIEEMERYARKRGWRLREH